MVEAKKDEGNSGRKTEAANSCDRFVERVLLHTRPLASAPIHAKKQTSTASSRASSTTNHTCMPAPHINRQNFMQSTACTARHTFAWVARTAQDCAARGMSKQKISTPIGTQQNSQETQRRTWYANINIKQTALLPCWTATWSRNREYYMYSNTSTMREIALQEQVLPIR